MGVLRRPGLPSGMALIQTLLLCPQCEFALTGLTKVRLQPSTHASLPQAPHTHSPAPMDIGEASCRPLQAPCRTESLGVDRKGDSQMETAPSPRQSPFSSQTLAAFAIHLLPSRTCCWQCGHQYLNKQQDPLVLGTKLEFVFGPVAFSSHLNLGTQSKLRSDRQTSCLQRPGGHRRMGALGNSCRRAVY